FRRKDGTGGFHAFIGGISREGLDFYSSESLQSGTGLEINLYFLDSKGREASEKVEGEVRWSAPFRESFISGVQFSEIITKKTSPRLFEYFLKSEEYLN
ncbi:MAG TPA: PilZ domain-containing protein, partial [Nitrospiria bacterium]|nr:PilZ domain-containing protein [Nitrospiria bacterium]